MWTFQKFPLSFQKLSSLPYVSHPNLCLAGLRRLESRLRLRSLTSWKKKIRNIHLTITLLLNEHCSLSSKTSIKKLQSKNLKIYSAQQKIFILLNLNWQIWYEKEKKGNTNFLVLSIVFLREFHMKITILIFLP